MKTTTARFEAMRPRIEVALVSEHASPLATPAGEDSGSPNVHVAALAALAVELGRRGCRVTVYTRRDGPHVPDRVELAPGAVVEHVPAGPAEPLAEDDLFVHMPAFADHLASRWRTDTPDLVHAHSWTSGWAAVRAAAGRVPVAQTFGSLGVAKTRHRGDAATGSADRQQVETELLSAVDHIVATCSDEATELTTLGADPERVTVVPYGIDPATFRPDGARLRVPTASGRRPQRYRLVVVSRLVPRKGIDDVVRALARIPETELVVAGGPDQRALPADPEVRRLRGIAQDLGVEDRITFLGGVPHSMVPALLRSADVVVSTPWYEPFGIVALEAMACGKPVVATAVGGQLDTVQLHRTGLLVEPRDPDGIAVAVQQLLANPSLRHRMGEEAVAVVRDRFTWEQVTHSTLDVYEQVTRTSDWWSVPA